jgi:spoIIIJ-associated protein
MLGQSDIQKIKTITEEFFKKMTLEVEVEILSPKNSTVSINLKLDEPRLLIGERGQTLAEAQHLLKAILKRKISEPFFIDLDVLGYKKKKAEYLRELARSLADEVAITKKEKQLASMPAYERRIIHLELAERPDVTTESVGQEPERSVIIRPYP